MKLWKTGIVGEGLAPPGHPKDDIAVRQSNGYLRLRRAMLRIAGRVKTLPYEGLSENFHSNESGGPNSLTIFSGFLVSYWPPVHTGKKPLPGFLSSGDFCNL